MVDGCRPIIFLAAWLTGAFNWHKRWVFPTYLLPSSDFFYTCSFTLLLSHQAISRKSKTHPRNGMFHHALELTETSEIRNTLRTAHWKLSPESPSARVQFTWRKTAHGHPWSDTTWVFGINTLPYSGLLSQLYSLFRYRFVSLSRWLNSSCPFLSVLNHY